MSPTTSPTPGSRKPSILRHSFTAVSISLGEKEGSYQHAGGVQLLFDGVRVPVEDREPPSVVILILVWALITRSFAEPSALPS